MKAQTAIEYLIIAGMVLAFMTPIWIYVVTTQQQAAQELSLAYAKIAVKQISDAASLVNSQGSPAKMNIKVYIPDRVDNVSIIDKTIIFKMRTDSLLTEIWYESNAFLQGEDEIPLNQGYYYFDIISHDTYVEINRTF